MTAEPKEIPQGPAVEAGRDQKYLAIVDDEAEAKLNGLREAHGVMTLTLYQIFSIIEKANISANRCLGHLG